MATDSASCEPDLSRAPGDAEGATAEAAKKEFDVDTLSKSELRMLLSVMEGELEARDLVIEALRARRKEVFIQERYGRFNLNDPFLALQRDYEAGAGDKEKPVCTNPLSILEAVMAHCRKMQERMSAQLAAAESRQKKLEMEKLQLQALEQEHKKLAAHLEEERGKNKHVVLMLVKECKQLSGKVVEEAQKLEEVMVKLEEEKKKTSELEDQLSAEKQRSAGMEAQLEKQLFEFDTEREQLRAKLTREEAHTTDLKEEIDKMKKMMEQMKKGNDGKPGLSLPRKTKDKRLASISVATEGPVTRSVACQTDVVTESTDPVKKLPLSVPIKPSTGSPLVSTNTKGNVGPSALLIRPGIDRQASHSDLGPSPPTALPSSASRIEENGPSAGNAPDLSNSTPSTPSGTAPAAAQTLGAAPQNHSQAPPVHSLHSPCANTHPGLNPRIQAARFRFQGNANDPDQNGNNTQSPPSRDVSPTSRDNLVAKQLARNTVTQALSRFTSPQAGASSRLGASPGGDAGTCPPVGRTGLKTPGAARVDRGNPPPIPPKKPGLSQTPSPPHPQLRASNAGAKVDNKIVASPPSTLPQGTKVVNEENVPKSSSPQLPPKPSIDLTVASAGCPVSALATSQVGAWPAETPGLNQPACTDSSLVIPTTVAFRSSINPVSASSRSPGASDSLLVTASGWSPSLTPLLMSGGPAPLAGRPTLLQQAAAQGNVTLLSMLLNEEGLDINYCCEDSHSALYSAAKNGHTDCVRLLLNAEARVDAADKNGFTPLCVAAAQGHFECIELLTAYNANINHSAAGGQTPLYLACKTGNKECIKLLLEAGTDRSIKTRDGWTPIHAAVDTGNVDSLKLLMYHRVPAPGNSLSAEEPKSGLFSLNGGESPPGSSKPVVPADLINHADKEGWTAAHIAASKGFKNCLEILCRHGGLEPERRDKCNRTVHDVATDDCKHLLENLNALKIPLRISVGEIQPSNDGSDDFECEHTICTLNIRKQTSWEDFSKAVSQALTNHFQAISSDGCWGLEDGTLNNTTDSCIGLGTSSIQSIMLGSIPWSTGQSFSQSPWDFMKKKKVEQVTVLLSGPQEGCLSSVTYTSMIPLQMLQNYLRLVEQYHNVIFHGPEGSLQDYIANQLALCMKHRQMAAGFPCEIVRAEVDSGFSKEQLVDVFISNACLIPVKQFPVKKKIIVILENLEKSSLSELLGDFLAPLENRSTESPCTFQKGNGTSECYYFHENCFLLGTLAKACLQGSDLLVQQHFRWVQLRWDCEPSQGLLQRFLRRKAVSKFRGQLPAPCDPVCKIVDWVISVWRQLNSCLARLGTPEALLGPKYFLSCPVVPGHAQATVKWMSKLWNAIIAPRVQEAILSRAAMNKQPGARQTASKKHPSQGQQAVVRAALSILLNKAILHGCPLPRTELDQQIADFKGGSFPLSIVSSYSKKKGESAAWRKVNTSPRKKPGHFSSPMWNKPDLKHEGMRNKSVPHLNINRSSSLSKQQSLENDLSMTLTLDHRLSLGSDDEADLVKELQSMCSSKSESDISKIADSREDLRTFDSSRTNPVTSAPVNLRMPVPQKEASPLSSHQTTECSNSKSKTELGVSRVKSFLPVPRSKVAQCSQNTKRSSSSSSNTRQLEINNNSKEENWNVDKHEHVEKRNK
ncbi:cortactin binding protein 2 [Rattus norvegicus]|uniref:Cortactin-binding protein 2 n=1 Tax=Rattus norvegicus TaxID=10116 RepID=CTTB2_RAT|nr:cortactin-binding protein 2 [Rattus norvegicus]Q2IBD4.1 RecName: Full=Cortactin-binding protein 2; Short=CortBP2 [Rattus norvegicus]AAR16316.1 cortactin-binding protein 2 [Rattus norvegicus]EDM15128.1 cortactin binding protein 2 [Rattus norvegicus]|eukprot:NP_001107873.1 cortactin-binding protein 2 [Rattus norvegicus]